MASRDHGLTINTCSLCDPALGSQAIATVKDTDDCGQDANIRRMTRVRTDLLASVTIIDGSRGGRAICSLPGSRRIRTRALERATYWAAEGRITSLMQVDTSRSALAEAGEGATQSVSRSVVSEPHPILRDSARDLSLEREREIVCVSE